MEPKKSLSDTIIPKLESMVKGMSAGERLPTETMLAKQFSVGRSTIRESLKILAYKKLIVRKNEGTFVAENTPAPLNEHLGMALNLDVTNLTELIELREILEIAIIRLAVNRATDEDILEIERLNWLLSEPGAPADQMQQRDMEFHDYIARTTGNGTLATLLHVVRQMIATSVEKPVLPLEVAAESTEMHEKLIHTLKEHDEEGAVQVMEEYLMSMDYES